jgi:hypothetical protein
VATSAELNTGTDNAKFASALALEGSKYTDQDGSKLYAVATGTNTYAITLTPAPTAYAAGNAYVVKFTNANTGAATLNVNGLGAQGIVKGASTPLVSGDISAGRVCLLVYDGTNFLLDFIETTAFHSNVANEYTALTSKTTLDAADVISIESSTHSFAKRQAPLSALLDSAVVPKTAAYLITTDDQGSLFTNEGTAIEVNFTLPPAASGLGPFHFYNQDTDGLRVIADAGDTIRIGVGAGAVTVAAGNVKPQNPSDIGAFMTVVAINATEWVAMSLNGSWTAT